MIGSLLCYHQPLTRLARRRAKLLRTRQLPTLLQEVLEAPLPTDDSPLKTQKILSIDLETTGLDPAKDRILSIGMVTIAENKILLKSAQHYYVNDVEPVKAETAVINHITPEQLSGGISLSHAVAFFLHEAKDKCILAHGGAIEQAFLSNALNIKELPLIWFDTLNIEKSVLSHKNINRNDFSLSALRNHYQLPDYDAHNALSDAIATAELFLAQSKVIYPSQHPVIKQLYKRSL
ncbi:exonuclease domain-containing protein [Providencia vermicola]|uniref:3'-5' exonuclease n=2 Tax=Providencia TaxID=586 RepID=A0AAI9I010_PROST|nr:MULTISPECIES: 3'-5' exonuclease [Providencia]ELR5045048.1 3'-5' exonuclease [Providencia rettgeri]ELR5035745.1 3'-5' exonuclease [Providencia stuartii]ELR5121824.1 3'-5' exonuclease [Providencia stuartii]ELR5290306.1 3'-5' exonuclease [Providencia stuartii]ELX8378562.1 3'-5' exonuclease [Providencia stuartii]